MAESERNIRKKQTELVVSFGSYEQKNGIETIEWHILDCSSRGILLISKYALDCQQYNTKFTGVTWETSSLRKWLNGTFLDTAFSDAEKDMILTTTVTADKNPEYSTDPGKNTQDKVFLLSAVEAGKYFTSDTERQCKPTAYAEAQGCYVNSDNGNCWWWLRSPGNYSDSAADVDNDGSLDYSGSHVNSDYDAVRPALWINLDS